MTVKFSAKQKAQIDKRFLAIYNLLTKRTWIKGNEAQDKDGMDVNPRDRTAKSFCLIGAVRHINGPVEEDIAALSALHILLDTEPTIESVISAVENKNCEDWGRVCGRPTDIFGIYDYLGDPNHEYDINIITDYNDDDDREFPEIKAMLGRARRLYDKLGKVWTLEQTLMQTLKAKKKALLGIE